MLGTWNLGTCSGGWSGGQPARNLEPRNLGTSSGGQIFRNAPPARLKFSFTTSIWSRDPRTWNLEPGTSGTWNLEPGTWNLEPGTYRQKSQKKSRLRRSRNLEPRNLEPLAAHAEPSEPEPRNRVTPRFLAGCAAVKQELSPLRNGRARRRAQLVPRVVKLYAHAHLAKVEQVEMRREVWSTHDPVPRDPRNLEPQEPVA